MTCFCDGHAFGCGCTDHCTKIIDLGRFTKRRDDINDDARQFFTGFIGSTPITWLALLIVCIGFWAGAYHGIKAMDRYAVEMQEDAASQSNFTALTEQEISDND